MTNIKKTNQYLSTSIPFVNADPHIGFAFELALTDALQRYGKLRGKRVWCQSGTDDNSLKNAHVAERRGVPVAQFVEQKSARFVQLHHALNVSFDSFVQTSRDERHAPAVHELWRRCEANGDIYKKSYSGLYCVGCEHFLTEEQLVGDKCPDHLTTPEVVHEENYFFRLSRYTPQIIKLVESNRLKIFPEWRKQEVLTLLRESPDDFSISRSSERSRGWGINVRGDASQVIYVWFDALANYLSGLGFPKEGALNEFWEGAHRTHVIGKGILRFHALYWPAILLSAGLPLPDELRVHGYLNLGGRKISKSLGNTVDPHHLIREFGADPVRYFLLRHVHTTKDSEFSRERLIESLNADLADGVGNLVRRTLSLVERLSDSKVPSCGPVGDPEFALGAEIGEAVRATERGYDSFAIHEAVAASFDVVRAANRYADAEAPWDLAKRDETERLNTVLYSLCESLRIVSVLLAPVTPGLSRQIAWRLGVDVPERWARRPGGLLKPGTRTRIGDVLFPKRSFSLSACG